MDSPDALASLPRLLAALEALSRREDLSLEERNFAAVVELQERSRAIVEKIGQLLASPHLPAALPLSWQERGQALAQAQQRRLELVREQLAGARAQWHATRAAQARLRRLRPRYAEAAPVAPRALQVSA